MRFHLIQAQADPSVTVDGVVSSVTQSAQETWSWLLGSGTQWAIWAAVAVGIFLVLRLLRSILSGIFQSSKLPQKSVRNIISRLFAATNSLFLLVFSFVVTRPFFIDDLSDRWSAVIGYVFIIAAALQVAFWARVIVKALLNSLVANTAEEESTLENARSLITLFANFAIFAIAVIFILQNLGQDVGALIAGLGVGGLAIGLAAQSVFRDLFASLSIILDKPFVKGDFIAWSGFLGTVQKIGLRTTRLTSLSGEQLVVSNDDLLSNVIKNFRRMNERRVVQTLGVTYQTPRRVLEILPERLRELLEGREGVRFDRSHMSGYGDSAITFETVYYVLSRDYAQHMDLQQDILLDIHKLFEDLGAEFAYPTQTLFIEGEWATGQST
ncbi:hypothetical protein PB2503_00812 [Parvularcula bermudensis HTCC2503]|uniref:Mechanosensitive ion channel family protein n=1 Tax=Parvularcula bermudensis (strain ATCC BAA-594 / HTCC2503 / KCTC 12087) TaxID=314260 RepID=E0TB34_PARBH|nr:mechanosensitive ion channel family protein [Parvularcula bermudensis]ADM08243.1 hypothetical protein PB2503_00812 [Parvularcula bermudensis HTCC2503]